MQRIPEQPDIEPTPEPLAGNLPEPASERGAWIIAASLGVLGVLVLVLALGGVLDSVSNTSAAAPPPVYRVVATPVAGATKPISAVAPARTHAILGDPSPVQAHRDLALYEDPASTHISERWMQGFYPIYEVAQKTFGVNWLLIASIHKQETDFSTAPTTYHGLNFAGCCGGPMQFNVKNGGPSGGSDSTWALVNDSYIYGARPSSYDHMTARHPSIYDDFDAIMAAAHLLSADGAEMELNDAAWNAAYDYYGHDLTGVTYADQVLARAIGWSQHGFCINCGLEEAMVQAVYGAYGASVAATYEAEARAESRPGAGPGRGAGKGKAAKRHQPGRSAPRRHGR